MSAEAGLHRLHRESRLNRSIIENPGASSARLWSRMDSAVTFFRSMLSMCLALWLALVVGAGMAAAIIFPQVKPLAPIVPSYSAYAGEHWRLAAGIPANRIFAFSTIAQLLFASLTIVALVSCHALARRGHSGGADKRRPGARIVLTICVTLAALAVAGFAFVIWPRMGVNFDAFLAHAKAGDNPAAEAARAAFDKDHPTSSRLFGVIAASLVVAVAALPGAFERRGTAAAFDEPRA